MTAAADAGPMIRTLVAPPVVACETFTERGTELFAEERAAVGNAVDKRRREFTTVRACARDAMAGLGYSPVPLVPGERGAPSWPAGLVGSMTHCDGYRAAVVAPDDLVASVGVDAEPNAPLPEGVLDTIALPPERTALTDLPAVGVAWDRLLFSAKESVYKTWFPLTRRWLDFDEAEIVFEPGGTFTARFLVPGPTVGGQPRDQVDGRWCSSPQLVMTAIVLPVV